MTAVTDSFDRANSTTTLGNADSGQTWIVQGGGNWGINNNQAYFPNPVPQGTAVIDSGASNGTLVLDVPVAQIISGGGGMCWRSTGANDHYVTNGAAAFRKQGGSFTNVATFSYTDGDTISVVLSGTSHTLKKNGVTSTSFTDSFQSTATAHGMRVTNSATCRLDNFSWTDAATAASMIPRHRRISRALLRR